MRTHREHLTGFILITTIGITAAAIQNKCTPYYSEYSNANNPPNTKPLSYICNVNSLSPTLDFSGLNFSQTLELNICCKESEDGILRPKHFSHLIQLRRLKITCSMKRLPEDTLTGLGNLQQLLLSKVSNYCAVNQISTPTLTPNLLKAVPKLEVVDFSYWKLVEMPRNFLCPVPNLADLILDYNYFTDLENIGCGSGCCQNIKTLIISNNRLVKITEKELQQMRKLKHINLSFNTINQIQENSLNAMTSLEFVNLQSNKLRTFPESLFALNKRLTGIMLKDNLIHELPDDLFTGLHELFALNLSKNKIRTLATSTFKTLYSLRNLDLSSNHVTDIPPNFFHYMPNMALLWMTDNNITSLEKSGIDRLFRLTDLNLSRNRLDNISVNYFSNLTSLKLLDLSENSIETPPSFHTLRNLSLLILSGNKMSKFQNGLQLGEQIEELHLAHNSIESMSFQDLNITFVRLLLISYNNLTSLSGLNISCPFITDLYVDHNSISYLGKSVYSMSKLVRFDVSHNVLKGEFDFSSQIPKTLEKLDISHNYLTSLSSTFDRPNDYKLREFNASFNRIRDIKSSVLPTSLIKIDLSNNNIMSIQPYSFESLHSLLLLKLAYNNLARTEQTWFEFGERSIMPDVDLTDNALECDCSNAWLLNRKYHFINKISYCKVNHQRSKQFSLKLYFANITADQLLCQLDNTSEECPPGCKCFHTLTKNVFEVDCGGQQNSWNFQRFPNSTTRVFLDNVTSVPFFALNRSEPYKKLTALFLNSSHISSLPSNAFCSVPYLTELHLENNQLQIITLSDLKTLHRLQFLYLHANQLQHIDGLLFTFLNKLTFIILHSNKLKNLTGITTSRTIRDIELFDNPFRCSCDYVPALQKWVLDRDVTVSEANFTYCTTKTEVKALLFEYNDSSCTPFTGKPSVDKKLVAVLITAGVFLLFLVFLVGAYLLRQEFLIYIYARFGIRFSKETRGDKTYDAFICYSEKDDDFVAKKLIPGLNPYRLCFHDRDFPVGGYIVQSVTAAVQQSCRTILVLSPNFVRSEWCMFEFITAHQQSLKDRCCRLIVIILEEVQEHGMRPELRLYLKTNTYLRWENEYFWNKLKYALPHLDPAVTTEMQLPVDLSYCT